MQINNLDTSYPLSRGTVNIQKQGTPKTIAEVWKEQGIESQPVRVDLSEEGLSAYKQMFQKDDSDRNFKSLNLRLLIPEGMAWGNEGWPDVEEFLGWGTRWKMMDGKMPGNYYDLDVSVKDKAAALLNAYKETYDEIVKGYENGTRVKYVVDMDTEALYRTATKEEDLAALWEEFEGRASALEKEHINACGSRKAMAAAYMEGFPYVFSLRDVLKYGIRYRTMKDEEKITNVKQGLLDAANAFIRQYGKAD